ncbi:MFS transporter [Sinomonas sp. ASV322]|uniref:MFS transporter n=1 Tax=Sinomonas sp. ASV322 TaxID=3041920 RepID=UPI0027DBB171|nr:MFS transporter [Sinomonas sp. ASV322]MDQ4503219.1 MFS transporter [Sinomonas sp. ASV322]
MTSLQRRVLFVAICSSCLVILDASAVNLALPAMMRELGGGLAFQQWVVDGYLLTLGAFILAAGSVADRYGRARVLGIGVIAFTATSLVCGFAWNDWVLVAARLLQGTAAAVVTPSALALITASSDGPVRARMIGLWTAWTSAAAVAAPFVGGAAVDLATWRLVFLVNVIPAALMWRPLVQLRKAVPPPAPSGRLDALGAGLAVVALGGIVLGLIEQGARGWADPIVVVCLSVGVVAGIAFAVRQRVAATPMLPLSLFRERNFAAGNLSTWWAYGALGVGFFILGLYLQQRMRLTAFEAGLGLLPATLSLLFLSPTAARIGARIGPRLPMALGPGLGAAAFAWIALETPPLNYWRDILAPVILFGIGLSIMVAPLTAAVLNAVPVTSSGIASAVNNAVARVASLVCIAAAGGIMGGLLDDVGFRRGMLATAVLLAASAATSAAWIRNPKAADGTSAGAGSAVVGGTEEHD